MNENTMVGFGKYKNYIWKDVQRDYLLWLMKQSWFDNSKDYHDYVISRINAAPPIMKAPQQPSKACQKAWDYLSTSLEELKGKKMYKFKSTKEGIDFQLIANDLSYSNPFSIVKVNKDIYAVIHKSIVVKAKNSFYQDTAFVKSLKKTKDTILKISYKDIEIIRNDISNIKSAKWVSKTVMVTVEEIKC